MLGFLPRFAPYLPLPTLAHLLASTYSVRMPLGSVSLSVCLSLATLAEAVVAVCSAGMCSAATRQPVYVAAHVYINSQRCNTRNVAVVHITEEVGSDQIRY